MPKRLVDLEIDGRDKQLNPRNIAYIITKNENIRFRGYIMGVLVFVMTIVPSIIADLEPVFVALSGIIGLVLTTLILLRMRGEIIQSVGTVNDSYDVSNTNMNMLRSAFEDSDSESFHIEGKQTTIFNKMEYSYYITPRNVVSIDRIDRSIPKWMIVVFVVISLTTIGFSGYLYTGVELASGVMIGMSLLAITSAFALSNRPDMLEIEFTNDETKRIPLSSERSKQIVEYLRGKRELSEIGSSPRKPKIQDGADQISSISGDDKTELDP